MLHALLCEKSYLFTFCTLDSQSLSVVGLGGYKSYYQQEVKDRAYATTRGEVNE
jgi:hypothetical protein